MSKKKPILVTIKEVTRKSKSLFQVTIDLPGNNPDDSPRDYYATIYSAKRGARRKLDAAKEPIGINEWGEWQAIVDVRGLKVWRPIQFVVVHKIKKPAK
jgi:hypothetical protein